MLGNVTLRRYALPELKPALRHLIARLASTLLLFALAWAALWLMGGVLPRRAGIASSLDLILFAALFAALFVLTNRLVERGVRWYLLPRHPRPQRALAHGTDLIQSLTSPEQLGDLILRFVQEMLGAEQGHLFGVEHGPGGSLLLAPLASLPGPVRPSATVLAGASPLSAFLQQEANGPLSTFDLAQGELFGSAPADEKETIAGWQSVWLLPLRVGPRLVGVLTLGDKFTGAPYYEHELAWLQKLALQAGPLLWQASQIATLGQLNGYLFERVDRLTREQQFLQELSALYQQFAALVSPALYAPFAEINSFAQVADPAEEASGAITQPLTELRMMIGRLVNVAGRVQQQQEFHFAPLHLNDAVQQAVRNLAPMAKARRVHVVVGDDARLPVIKGDEERLAEAIQHLLHNAIKFNKIGGEVWLDSGMAGNELYLRIRDTGVGIPPERTNQVWQAVSQRQNGRNRSSSDGVGLLLARFIVRAHGGRLEMSSHYGAGTTFSVFLPLALES
jgi:signal transduction histidine kinase